MLKAFSYHVLIIYFHWQKILQTQFWCSSQSVKSISIISTTKTTALLTTMQTSDTKKLLHKKHKCWSAKRALHKIHTLMGTRCCFSPYTFVYKECIIYPQTYLYLTNTHITVYITAKSCGPLTALGWFNRDSCFFGFKGLSTKMQLPEPSTTAYCIRITYAWLQLICYHCVWIFFMI